mmetsp:Transcript_12684/g.44925  ORF Transcript_12684/g.44925 Transcript_12684/m.44925 type:complete len:235 (+) Transcript_12684:1031-1735(+)
MAKQLCRHDVSQFRVLHDLQVRLEIQRPPKGGESEGFRARRNVPDNPHAPLLAKRSFQSTTQPRELTKRIGGHRLHGCVARGIHQSVDADHSNAAHLGLKEASDAIRVFSVSGHGRRVSETCPDVSEPWVHFAIGNVELVVLWRVIVSQSAENKLIGLKPIKFLNQSSSRSADNGGHIRIRIRHLVLTMPREVSREHHELRPRRSTSGGSDGRLPQRHGRVAPHHAQRVLLRFL